MYIYKTTSCMVAWYFSVSEVLSNKAAPAATYPQRPWPTHEDIIDIWSGLAWHEFFFFWPFLPTSLHLVFFFKSKGIIVCLELYGWTRRDSIRVLFFCFLNLFLFSAITAKGGLSYRERERERESLVDTVNWHGKWQNNVRQMAIT